VYAILVVGMQCPGARYLTIGSLVGCGSREKEIVSWSRSVEQRKFEPLVNPWLGALRT
jgi:hypothetical protein